MIYLFVKGYNPAYDYFVTEFFNKRGIPLDDQATLKEMRAKVPLRGRSDLLPHEKLFLFYLGQWSLHPETRPSQIEILQNTFDDKRLTVARLRELQASLPKGIGKLLLSQEDVATDISKFYRHVVTKPLRKAVEKKVSPMILLDYFNAEDTAGLPYSRDVDRRDFERAAKELVKESLLWLDKITADSVSSDISIVFQQHAQKGHRMQPIGAPHKDGRRTLRCEHNSKIVQLHCSREPEDFEDHWLLQPSRGYGAVEDGWKDVVFPRFIVLEEPESLLQGKPSRIDQSRPILGLI